MATSFSFNGAGSSGPLHEIVSPVTGRPVDRVALASRADVARAMAALSGPAPVLSAAQVFEFLERLMRQLVAHRETLLEKTILETGFIHRDSLEMVDGAIEFLRDFETYVREHAPAHAALPHSLREGPIRQMLITRRPYRCIAAIVPQNASLALSITIVASALYAGSRVIVRNSLQSGSTGALLGELIERSDPPDSAVRILNCLASDFMDACYEADDVDLIHYIGGNQYALAAFVRAFEAKKHCLLDGQGNGLLYVDGSFPLEDAARLITSGATRFNGETCTSINGVLVEERIFPALRDALVDSFRALRVGDPTDPCSQVGPLFSMKQAHQLAGAIRNGAAPRVLCGGEVQGAYFAPAVVENVGLADPLPREGFFGPALWIHPIREEMLFPWIRANQFPLSDTVLSTRPELVRVFAANSRAARVCVNQDPSVESMFEPWGGYPPSGLNPVSAWVDKYRQTFQLDGQLRDIAPAAAAAERPGA